jgi:cysteine desulfurase
MRELLADPGCPNPSADTEWTMNRPLYFDYNATTPVLPSIVRTMLPYFSERFGNPASAHLWGIEANAAVALARGQVATLLDCAPEEIVFTSCATEANNLALLGLLQPPLDHVIVSAIEHPAVLEPATEYRRRGGAVTIIPVDGQGRVDPEALRRAITQNTRLISIMLANNEVGTIQPVAEIASIAKEHGILLHTDAAQAVGKIPVTVNGLGVDMLTLAGHKLYAPKGVGALYVRKGVGLGPLSFGGGQEGGLRPGTENVPYLVALGEACRLAGDVYAEQIRQRDLRDRFEEGLGSLGIPFRVHGRDAERLPNTTSVGFKGLRTGDLLSGLVGADVAVSAGAACHGDIETVSHVLVAMNVDPEHARGTLRFSFGRPTTEDDVLELLNRLDLVIRSLRS